MPAVTTPRRVSKRKVPSSARSNKRRSPRAKASRRETTEAASDALLIAQFAEALGGRPARKPQTSRRSLIEALEGRVGHTEGFIDVIGARVASEPRHQIGDGRASVAPCLAVHQRHRVQTRLRSAGAWGIAMLVSAGIISAAALGILAQAPGAANEIKTASAAQF